MTEGQESNPEFNMAVMYLTHVHELIILTSKCARYGEIETWMTTLKTLFRKVCPFFSKDERKKVKEKFEEIMKLIYDPVIRVQDNLTMAPRSTQIKYKKNMAMALEMIDLLEQDIMIKIDEKKLLMPKLKKSGLKALSESIRRGK